MRESNTPHTHWSPEKLRLVEQRLRERRANQSSTKVIHHHTPNEPLPLSHNQLGLWVLDQLSPGNPAYNTSRKVTLKGRLDIENLRASLETIIARHTALRTVFEMVDSEPMQKAVPPWTFELPVIDLRKCPVKLETELRNCSEQAFYLTKGPLLRATIFKLKDDLHVMLIVAHHIIYDGYSMGILHRELEELYNAHIENRSAALPPPSCQFRDFVAWQREELTRDINTHKKFWRDKLNNAEPLRLPTLRRPVAQDSSNIDNQHFSLSIAETNVLKEIAKSENCTLFLLLSAALNTLLYRHTEQEDLIIGIPSASRLTPETNTTIGYFVNTLIFRTDLSEQPTFREVLRRTRQTAQEAYQHDALPFDMAVETLRPDRVSGENPYIKVMINYYDYKWTTLNLTGLEPACSDIMESHSSFPLTLDAIETPSGLRLGMRYMTAAFDDARITALSDQFRFLLQQIAKTIDITIDEYSLLSPTVAQILPSPDSPIDAPHFQPVAELFFAVSTNTPARIAIDSGDRSWDYRELSDNVQRIAARLQANGLPCGSVVAIIGERSFGLISALVACMSSGYVFVIIDPELPAARQKLMLQESGSSFQIHICTPRQSTLLQNLQDDDTALQIPAYEHYDPKAATGVTFDFISPENDAAYIFFTSGSTGKPKAILGTHQGLSHLLTWQRSTFRVGAEDRVSQLTRLSFDAVLRDIFLPLTSGATLCLPNKLVTADNIFQWLAEQRVTILHTIPSIARAWLSNRNTPSQRLQLRYTFFSGETLSSGLIDKWRQYCDQAEHLAQEIVNLYGPTETTLIKTYHRVPNQLSPGIQPIGIPIPNTQVFNLNKSKQLCGAYETGELVIRTPFSTLGYINIPAGPTNGFMPNPLGDTAPKQVYFTGDLGYFDYKGILHIVGRNDDQIKINGVRIDPKEVELKLAQMDSINTCAVVGLKDKYGNGSMTAYLITDHEKANQGSDLEQQIRHYLNNCLPLAMIPANFIFIDELPLTANGKTDYKALRELNISVTKDHSPPHSETEATLMELWGGVLQQEDIGSYSNFFHLGGNSIRATQLMARINERFNIGLHFRIIFEAATLAELASEIDKHQQKVEANDNLAELLQEAEGLQIEEILAEIEGKEQELSGQRNNFFNMTSEFSREDKTTILDNGNATNTDYPREASIQQLFEAQVTSTPDAIALIFADQQLSYRELNDRANQLAHYLIQHNVKAEKRVAICMERSIEAVIAILAVIKAGGAYVPLDTSYPPERQRFMLEDSNVVLILTHNNLITPECGFPLVDIGHAAMQINECSDSNPQTGNDPERLLYVMYTSGSTGTPKGVEVPHRAVNRLVQNSGFAEFGPQHTFMLLAPISFDASTLEIWGALLNGSCCVIYPARLPEFELLRHTIEDNDVTTLWLTASLFNHIIDEAPHTLAGIKQLLTGGEALSVKHINLAQQVLPDTQLINGYGPTENTTFTCCYRIPASLDKQTKSIPIGRPIGNTRVYVLDEQMQCVPIGVPGELYAAGAGLARGYQNRPDLTAEKFVDNPFKAGDKIYKTGDLVRYLPDGNLEFLGRIDQQIKLRGFRIEPGEIETVLHLHESVDNCIVILREDIPGNKQLVAYVVLNHEADNSVLENHLRANLPAYMVPAAIVRLNTLPLNANGKIDTRALPKPGIAYEQPYLHTTPANEMERAVTTIWEEVLSTNNIDPNDNFFSVGGQSILAMQVIAKINKTFHVAIPLKQLFEHPTITALAHKIELEQILLITDSDEVEAQLKAIEEDSD